MAMKPRTKSGLFFLTTCLCNPLYHGEDFRKKAETFSESEYMPLEQMLSAHSVRGKTEINI